MDSYIVFSIREGDWTNPVSFIFYTYEEERHPIADAVLGDSTKKHDAVLKSVTKSHSLSNSLNKMSDNLTSGLLIAYPFSSLIKSMSKISNDGPQPGDRALDAKGLYNNNFKGSLVDLLRGPHWTLLIFTDNQESPIPCIHNKDLKVYKITRTTANKTNEIVDLEGNAYQTYFSEENDVVLVRPDGYIALRGREVQESTIFDYLNKVLPHPVKIDC